MQRTTGFEQLTGAELIRAAQYGDAWAREQLIGGAQPLVHALASRALGGRPGADAAVSAIVRDTSVRAEFGLGTLPSPDAFRPWLIGIGVASILAHTADLPLPADPSGASPASCWIDIEDAVLAALWSLEQEGLLGRYETATALQWSPDEVALRLETVSVRMEAARSVATALARVPRCPGLDEYAAAWDGRPGAAWRDRMAGHTAGCGHCATGFPAARADIGRPVHAEASVTTAVGASAATVVGASAAAARGGVFPDVSAPAAWDADTRTFEAVLADTPGHTTPVAGRRGTRADRRRRRQTDERNRRRAVVAAGLAVVAVTGGAFTLNAGRGGDDDLLEANRAAAPGLDLPLSNDLGTLSASPSTPASASTPSASASATGTPRAPKPSTATPSKAPRPTTAAPAPKRSTAPARTTAPATAPKTANSRGSRHDSGQSSVADQVIALVNAERAKVGCGALTANAALTSAAQGHSDDMAARDFFDHTNPDGAGPGDRVTAAGYPWSTYGENIAMGQTSPEQVMESWMNSPGHRANILNCDFKEIGIGIHDSGGPYWTQVFGAR
ncbi:CAP domain-containing protein [Streptomyces sp. NPDC020422]|uniref:CAP domain-containing protein n=1 Tax=Streptomyces sp. NPDC020422 TaxID=3365074 RepID=UPI00379F39D4